MSSIIDLYISSTFFAAGLGLSASFLLEFSCLQEKTVDLELDFPLDFFKNKVCQNTEFIIMCNHYLLMFFIGMHFFVFLSDIFHWLSDMK